VTEAIFPAALTALEKRENTPDCDGEGRREGGREERRQSPGEGERDVGERGGGEERRETKEGGRDDEREGLTWLAEEVRRSSSSSSLSKIGSLREIISLLLLDSI